MEYFQIYFEQVKFFYDHAGFGYDPKTETREQARVKCAGKLAEAETIFKSAPAYIEWAPDHDCEDQPAEWAAIYIEDEDGQMNLVASLSGIVDADDDYRRVIRAELALEAIEQLKETIK